MTTETVTPAELNDHPECKEQRAKFVAGLREFATWLEERPWAPIVRGSGYVADAKIQIDLYGGAGLAEVRSLGALLGVKVQESMNDRTSAGVIVGSVDYCVIAWHPGGRPGEREAELERLRAEVAELRAAQVLLPVSAAPSGPDCGHAACQPSGDMYAVRGVDEEQTGQQVPAGVDGVPVGAGQARQVSAPPAS